MITASEAADTGRANITATITTTIIILAISGVIILVGIKLIVSSVNQLKRRMDDIAEGKGDLTKRVPVDTNDELGQLAKSCNAVLENLQEMITNLQNGVSDIVTVMETGRQQANQSVESAGKAESELTSILEGMNQITDINSSVASATEQQTQAVEEINQNVTRINDLAQDSDERSQNLSSISETVAENAQSLSSQVARFRV